MRDKPSILSNVKWFLYDVKVKLFGRFEKNKKPKAYNKKIGQTVFLIFFLLFPIAQFLLFYVGVAANTLKLAFQVWDPDTQTYFFSFKTFERTFNEFFVTGEMSLLIKNSAIQFATSLFIGMPIQIMVAYVVFKQVPLSNVFKVILFMPNIISSLVFVMCAKVLVQKGLPFLFNDDSMRLLNPYNSSSFYTVLIFGMWMNFAGGLIIYLSAMCSIPKDIMEYGQLENMSSLKEFWYIVLPSIFPTIVTYIIVAIAAFFTNYGHFYSFYGGEGSGMQVYMTLGLYFFKKVAGGLNTPMSALRSEYPIVSASGILFTAIVAPITFLTKHLLEKFGPSED